MTKKEKIQNEKTPDELLAELESEQNEFEVKRQKILDDIKKSKERIIEDAAKSVGEQFTVEYTEFAARLQSVRDKKAEMERIGVSMDEDVKYINSNLQKIFTQLTDAGVKDEYISEVLGLRAPTPTSSSSTNGRKKRTKARLPDGSILTWSELLAKYGIAHKEGDSAHREWDNARKINPELPDIEEISG